jgi:uncharacterized membrane protein YccC
MGLAMMVLVVMGPVVVMGAVVAVMGWLVMRLVLVMGVMVVVVMGLVVVMGAVVAVMGFAVMVWVGLLMIERSNLGPSLHRCSGLWDLIIHHHQQQKQEEVLSLHSSSSKSSRPSSETYQQQQQQQEEEGMQGEQMRRGLVMRWSTSWSTRPTTQQSKWNRPPGVSLSR